MLIMMNHHIQQSKFISVVDIIYDKSLNLEQLKAIRKSLIFDNDINLSKLTKDHQWYIDQLNKPKPILKDS